MDAACNFSLGFTQETELKGDTRDRLRKGRTLQKIFTGLSLIVLCLGFSIFGVLMILNRHHADLDGFSGESSIATVGGVGAILLGLAFLVAACLHRKFLGWTFWCDDPKNPPWIMRQGMRASDWKSPSLISQDKHA